MSFGEQLQRLRRGHNLTQEQLADALGIDGYFPSDAVPVGAFEEKSEAGYREFVNRRWSFGDYLRDAFRVLIGETDPR